MYIGILFFWHAPPRKKTFERAIDTLPEDPKTRTFFSCFIIFGETREKRSGENEKIERVVFIRFLSFSSPRGEIKMRFLFESRSTEVKKRL